MPGGLAVEQLGLESSRVRFQVTTEDLGVLSFGGQLKDEELAGDVQTVRGKGTFRLVHIATVDPQIYDLYSGTYQ
jgi:hypothetical protein